MYKLFLFPLNFEGFPSRHGQPEFQYESPEGMLLWPCWGKCNEIYLKICSTTLYHCVEKELI